jgi:hypothetical protein
MIAAPGRQAKDNPAESHRHDHQHSPRIGPLCHIEGESSEKGRTEARRQKQWVLELHQNVIRKKRTGSVIGPSRAMRCGLVAWIHCPRRRALNFGHKLIEIPYNSFKLKQKRREVDPNRLRNNQVCKLQISRSQASQDCHSCQEHCPNRP